MPEQINETVSVNLLSRTNGVIPWAFLWRGRMYKTKTIGFHHTMRQGRVLLHIFSVSDGATYFKLVFDTETLGWKLLEVDGQDEVQ
jgi:hypothetical protein